MSDLTPEEIDALHVLLQDEIGQFGIAPNVTPSEAGWELEREAVRKVREKVLAFERGRGAPVKLDADGLLSLVKGERVVFLVGEGGHPVDHGVVTTGRGEEHHPVILARGFGHVIASRLPPLYAVARERKRQ